MSRRLLWGVGLLQIEVAVARLVRLLYVNEPDDSTPYDPRRIMVKRNKELYEKYTSGISARQLAEEYGISETRVYELIKNYREMFDDE